MKKNLSVLLALVLCLALVLPGFASAEYVEIEMNGFTSNPPYYGMFGVTFEAARIASETLTFYSDETGYVTEENCPMAIVKPGSQVVVDGGYAAGMEDIPDPPFRANVQAYKLRDDGSYEPYEDYVTLMTGSVDDWPLGKSILGEGDVAGLLLLSGFGERYVRLGEAEAPAPAAPNGVSVSIRGEAVNWTDAEPFIDENNRTMVPLRAVAEALGLTVSWDGSAREASFTDGQRTIVFPIGSTQARLEDGSTVQMDTAAVIVNNRTFAPIRYLAVHFGYTVDWDKTTRTVLID